MTYFHFKKNGRNFTLKIQKRERKREKRIQYNLSFLRKITSGGSIVFTPDQRHSIDSCIAHSLQQMVKIIVSKKTGHKLDGCQIVKSHKIFVPLD